MQRGLFFDLKADLKAQKGCDWLNSVRLDRSEQFPHFSRNDYGAIGRTSDRTKLRVALLGLSCPQNRNICGLNFNSSKTLSFRAEQTEVSRMNSSNMD